MSPAASAETMTVWSESTGAAGAAGATEAGATEAGAGGASAANISGTAATGSSGGAAAPGPELARSSLTFEMRVCGSNGFARKPSHPAAFARS